MIHYILIPTKERHALRREYRLRLAIVAFLFISCALVVGIVSLIPSYLSSRAQERDAQIRQDVISKTRRESGAEKNEQELILAQAIAQKINQDKDPVPYGDLIQKIVSYRKKDLAFTVFNITQDVGSSTIASITLQGNSGTRESLLQFKKDLEADKSFGEIDLPLSDLAKSKDVFFTIRFKATKQ